MTAVDLQLQARALGDPTRHRIFRLVADAPQPIGVAELTREVGLHHNAVRQHLARLVEAGLVVESVAPPHGRGRPALRYVVDPTVESRWDVRGPFERLSWWLAEVIRTGDTPFEVGRRVGRRRRDRIAASGGDEVGGVDAVAAEMAVNGFEPQVRRRGDRVEIVLANCPFESAAAAEPGTICELHRGIATGVAEVAGGVVVDELVVKDSARAGCRLRCSVEPPREGRGA